MIFADQILGYYSTLFAHVQQKDISGFLTFLWQTDPFKAKWSILAKAYSVIRDQNGKENAPLDHFLSINAGFVGIVVPASYLDMLGWEISADVDGQILLRREFEVDTNSLDSHLLTTNKSVDDVIHNSYRNGYIVGGPSVPAVVGHAATLTMATSAQPSSHAANNVTAAVIAGDKSANDGEGKDPEGESQPAAESAEDMEGSSDVASDNDNDAQDVNDVVESGGNGGIEANHVLSQGAPMSQSDTAVLPTIVASPKFDPNHLSPETLQWINSSVPDPAVDPPVSSLTNTAFQLSGEYPFASEFDPELSCMTFDPFMGNRFNSFNMSDWVNEEGY